MRKNEGVGDDLLDLIINNEIIKRIEKIWGLVSTKALPGKSYIKPSETSSKGA